MLTSFRSLELAILLFSIKSLAFSLAALCRVKIRYENSKQNQKKNNKSRSRSRCKYKFKSYQIIAQLDDKLRIHHPVFFFQETLQQSQSVDSSLKRKWNGLTYVCCIGIKWHERQGFFVYLRTIILAFAIQGGGWSLLRWVDCIFLLCRRQNLAKNTLWTGQYKILDILFTIRRKLLRLLINNSFV